MSIEREASSIVTQEYNTADLEAYLDEALDVEEMGLVERALRERPELLQELRKINARRDAGVHTVGEIWRRHRISCPTRDQLGSYLLGVLDEEAQAYVDFHLKVVHCRFCKANMDDMQKRQAESAELKDTRRRRYFDSSAGYLRKDDA